MAAGVLSVLTSYSKPMTEVPRKLQDLIATNGRIEIFEAVASLGNTFTIQDVCSHLQANGSYVRVASVQTLLRALYYRGYLEQFAIKKDSRRGRSTIHFRKNDCMLSLRNVEGRGEMNIDLQRDASGEIQHGQHDVRSEIKLFP